MIKMYEWRKDRDSNVMDRWIMPLIKMKDDAIYLDFQFDARSNQLLDSIRRNYKWLERHTRPASNELVYEERGIKRSSIISFIFEELHDL